MVAIIIRSVLTLMKIEGKGPPAFIQCHVLESVATVEKEGVDEVMKRKEGQG